MSVVLFVIAYRPNSPASRASSRDGIAPVTSERAPEIRKILDREGGRILILRLQGVIFFGTAGDLNEHHARTAHTGGRIEFWSIWSWISIMST